MTTSTIAGLSVPHWPVRRIGIEEPSRWLLAGWHDFRRAPGLSLGYGFLFVLIGYFIVLGLHAVGLDSLLPAMIAGFFLVAPVLAVGLYQVSRLHERGRQADWPTSLAAVRRNFPSLAGMGLVLVLCFAAWLQVALLIFMMFFHATPPALDNFVYSLLMEPDAALFLLTGTVVGAAIATVVFAVSAVSIPMLLDRDVPVHVAVFTSAAAVRDNWLVMLSWAATIVLLVAVGVATLFLGLAVILPWLAYATWHAYRGLVEQED